MKAALLGLVVCAAGQLQASVIAAWDFSNQATNAGSVAGWATIADTDLSAGTVSTDVIADGANYTLKAMAGYQGIYLLDVMTQGYVSQTGADTLLDVGNSTVGNDGFKLLNINKGDDRVAIFELAGLVEGQEYRIQAAGFITTKEGVSGRNITMEAAGKSAEVADQSYIDSNSNGKIYGSYSKYIDFTADPSGKTEISFWIDEASVSGISGLVVEAIPEPAAIGLFAGPLVGLLLLRRRLS
ncbi:hypothetical protein SCARR_01649 [Pontiella sulfatireligans]|uniref:PEP-CTERM protein-sorting domain-containing protein n=2 Tax=Pontiella sulfatireligans TaxID=2750658 RepID=A0A6C2UHC4_9BACT|nr:hypothetical protein SCARR_01649 [Pontiella sulfatireligans]